MKIKFEIPGKIMGKQRHRSTRNGKMYTPSQTVNYEDFVRYIYYSLKDRPWFTEQTKITIETYQKIPSGTSKIKTKKMLKKTIRPAKKPDSDNVLKIIMDGLKGVAYPDDNIIVEAFVRKFYGLSEKAIVILEKV